MPGRQPVPGASPLDMSPATSAQSMKRHTARDGGNRIASGTSDRERAGRFGFKQLCSCRRSGYAATVGTPARPSSARAEPAFLTSYLLRPRISVAVPDATLPRQLGNCSRRYPNSYFPVVVLPALPCLGNRSCVALPPASLQSSCIHAVVLPPWSRAHIALGCVLNVVSATPARILSRTPCSHRHLRALATIPGEKCGLAGEGSSYLRPAAGLSSPRRCITRTVRSTNGVSTSSLQANRLPSVLAGDLRMDN